MQIKVNDPFEESNFIISIVKNYAYKSVIHDKGITDFSVLKNNPNDLKEFRIDLKHTEKMFLECILRLREINNVKSEYFK